MKSSQFSANVSNQVSDPSSTFFTASDDEFQPSYSQIHQQSRDVTTSSRFFTNSTQHTSLVSNSSLTPDEVYCPFAHPLTAPVNNNSYYASGWGAAFDSLTATTGFRSSSTAFNSLHHPQPTSLAQDPPLKRQCLDSPGSPAIQQPPRRRGNQFRVLLL